MNNASSYKHIKATSQAHTLTIGIGHLECDSSDPIADSEWPDGSWIGSDTNLGFEFGPISSLQNNL